MDKNKRIKIIAIASLGVMLLTGGIVYRIAKSGGARDRISAMLHLKGRIALKGDTQDINNRSLLHKYYELYGYQDLWTQQDESDNRYRNMLIDMLSYADSLGLDRSDYHDDFIRRYDSLSHRPGFDYGQYKTESELIFSDAAISFLHNVAYGKDIQVAFDGYKYTIDSNRILTEYNNLLKHRNWHRTLDNIEPRIPQYLQLKHQLNSMRAFLGDFPEVDTLSVVNSQGATILAATKLRFYGFITDSIADDSTGMVKLRPSLVGFQQMMGLDTTGKLDSRTLTALNVPLSKRMKQMKESLNYWRWTGRVTEDEFILINIPAARLQVVNQDSVADFNMRVIVGKNVTQTPSFTSYISKVIAYPYWTVPFSIATKEMLPKIRSSISYLENNNLQVLNAKGEVIDPAGINWDKFSTKYFPYTIRQGTGCDNSLGVLKFDINSPFSIYLHDTNRRDLFAKKDRFMSHGCIRLEKPMELAHYILDEGLDSTTTAKLNQCLKDQKPKDFFLKKKFPVLIFYMTADIDASGNLKFYKDVYELEKEEEAGKSVLVS